MSSIRQSMEEEDALRDSALDILVRTGRVSECPNHPRTYLGEDDDLVDAYKLANSLISKGKLDIGNRSRKDFMAIVDSVYSDNSGDECYSCAKVMAE